MAGEPKAQVRLTSRVRGGKTGSHISRTGAPVAVMPYAKVIAEILSQDLKRPLRDKSATSGS